MIYTNKTGLPQPIVDVITQEDYVAADNEFRVTSLIKGLKQTILERRHDDEIEVDVSDLQDALWGTAIHYILENSQEREHLIKEDRLKAEIDGITISGKPDLYNSKTKTLTDYKTAKVWKFIFNDFVDWQQQLKIYSWLLSKNGMEVQRAEIVGILKDFSKLDVRRKQGYPQCGMPTVSMDITPEMIQETEQWLKERVRLLKGYLALPDDEIPECEPDERWANDSKFAVMKKGRKSALRLFDLEEDALDYLETAGDYIEYRAGIDPRCMDYCPAKQFCHYWQERYGEQ